MVAIHETAYPRIKSNLNQHELVALFTLSDAEMALLKSSTKKTNSISRLSFALLLKCYQYLGRPINVDKVNAPIKKYLAKQLFFPPASIIKTYAKTTRQRHIYIIRQYLNINADKKSRRVLMKTTALHVAKTKENLADIINCVLEELICHNYELPVYQALVRLARAARTVTHYAHYKKIVVVLSDVQKELIDKMLDPVISAEDELSWLHLKQEPRKPTNRNVRAYILYANQLKMLRNKLAIDVSFIPYTRLEHLRDEAMVTDRADMRKTSELKRYALVVILIYMKSASAIDDLVHIFIIWVRRIIAIAKQRLEEYRLTQAENIDDFILLLYNMLLAIKSSENEKKILKAIEAQFSQRIDDIDTTIKRCKDYLGLTEEKHITWMLKPYRNKRCIIFNLLNYLSVVSSTQDKSMENALCFIKHHHYSKQEWLKINELDTIQPELSFLSKAWLQVILKKEGEISQLHRHYYEIAVLETLMGDLNCGDAYVKNAFIYDDLNKQFIPWDKFAKHVDQFCEIVKLPKEARAFVASQKTALHKAANTVDIDYPKNKYLVIDNGKPILKKLPAKQEHPEVNTVRKLLMDEMPIVNIVDIMIDVERWVNVSNNFKPLSGKESKIAAYPSRFVATSLSYGCNMGPTQTERCLPAFSRKQIAWLFNHHITEVRMNKSIFSLVNKYNLFALPKHWGTGESVSVDGTFWDMYQQNLLAAHHIRYGRYGGVGYYHVSDQYIALFSNFISSAVHESIYLLDGIVENDSDIQPKKVHGDSWAQSEVLFGLAFLLGILIMPRIKQFKHLHYYKASSEDFYHNINDLFTEKSIDWKLIETYYNDMLRIAISIQQGTVKTSTVLHRLCSKSRKNKLYYAFRELGRVRRSIFLLDYINDPKMRRMIQAATCKSEEFNEFISWIRFGGGGIISDNLRYSQRKIIKYSHLLANILIFHTVVNQTKAINKLRSQGIAIPDAALSGLSPYWREHINRFGVFSVNMDKVTEEVQYDLEEN